MKARISEPIYKQNPVLTIRPGKKTKLTKVSVGVDATPVTRTESILNQIPIELAQDLDMVNNISPYGIKRDKIHRAAQVVVIEHHHSRSDPLPMEHVFECAKSNFPTTRICESDSGSASSLYAKINPKLKTRLVRLGALGTPDETIINDRPLVQTPEEDIYGKTMTKMTTFGSSETTGDINVTSQEPKVQNGVISPEEALKTIKRRNYPKVLPDIKKRRSLPAPNCLFVPKLYEGLSKDHRHGLGAVATGYAPPLPPRMCETSKSLDLAEEVEEREPITTNLHVGPLLKRQDSTHKNNSDSNLIDSLERVAVDSQEVLFNHRGEYTDNLGSGSIADNPKCRLHGAPYLFSIGTVPVETITSQSVDCLDKTFGNPNWYRINDSSASSTGIPNSLLPNIIGNPNWYKPVVLSKHQKEQTLPLGAIQNNFDTDRSLQNFEAKSPAEPKIVITPRVGNLLGQSGQNLNQMVTNMTSSKNISQEPRNIATLKTGSDRILVVDKEKMSHGSSTPTAEQKTVLETRHPINVSGSPNLLEDNTREPKITISIEDLRNPSSTFKQPKIIIKPTANVQRNRDQRNIPKVSAIPSPKVQNFQNTEKDTKGVDHPLNVNLRLEKPPIREKPKVSRFPSISRHKDERSGVPEQLPAYQEKADRVERVKVVSLNKFVTIPLNSDKSITPSIPKKESDSSANTTNSSNSNTNTVKRKPFNKKYNEVDKSYTEY